MFITTIGCPLTMVVGDKFDGPEEILPYILIYSNYLFIV